MRLVRRFHAWAQRRPRWAWWLGIGAPLGGVVAGCLAVPVFLVDSMIQGGGVTADDTWVLPVVVIIVAMWGVLGGFASGAVCAAVIRLLDRRSPRANGRTDAALGATVTALFAAPIGLSALTGVGQVSLWDVTAWVLIPIAVTATVAARTGAWIWRQTQPGSAVASATGDSL